MIVISGDEYLWSMVAVAAVSVFVGAVWGYQLGRVNYLSYLVEWWRSQNELD